MVKRLPKYAERLFALLCSGAGALAHKAEEDESGWDYLVEFPKAPHPGPADTHPPAPTAYVQVKSTKTSRRSCRIKLSNALNAAQSRQPWFVVLLRFDKNGELINTYAVHFWEQLMRQTLEAVRKAVNAATPLHQGWVSIKFSKVDEHKNLIEWMQECISAVGDDYEAKKKSHYQSLGYEEGSGIGQLTVQAKTAEEITDGFLGLGDGLKITQFVFTPARFGIPDPTPQVDITEGRIVVSPNPVGTCEIRMRAAGKNLSLPGQIFSFSTPDMPDAQKSLRFSTSFLHLIGTKNSTKLRFRLALDFEKKLDLLTLWQFSTVRSLLAGDQVDVQVWVDGRRALAGDLNANLGDKGGGWSQLSSFLGLLQKVAGTHDVRICIADLAKTTREETIFSSINSDSNIRLEFIPLPGSPTNISSLTFYSRARVADYNFYVLSTRSAEDLFVDGRRQITCSKPAIIESYAIQGGPDAGVELIEADYNRYLDRQKQVETPLGLGNIHEFLRSLAASE
jgi:hypothetical protein